MALSRNAYIRCASWLMLLVLVAGISLVSFQACMKFSAKSSSNPVSAGDAEDNNSILGVHSVLQYDTPFGIEGHAQILSERLNAAYSRNGIDWNLVQPNSDVEPDFSQVDTIVDSLKAKGIEPLMTLSRSPCWANFSNPSDTTTNCRLYIPISSREQFTEWVRRYAVFVRKAVTHFRGRVKLWELWNEPNISAYGIWGAPSDGFYVQWARAIDQAIREVDPAAKVAWGGVVFLDSGPPGTPGRGLDFIQAMYNSGARPKVVSVHVYPRENEGPDERVNDKDDFRDIEKDRQLMVSYVGEDSEIWITEYGWYTSGAVEPWVSPISAELQAQYFTRSAEIMRNEYPYVKMAIWFIDINRWANTAAQFGARSLLLYDNTTGALTDKPITAAFKAATHPSVK